MHPSILFCLVSAASAAILPSQGQLYGLPNAGNGHGIRHEGTHDHDHTHAHAHDHSLGHGTTGSGQVSSGHQFGQVSSGQSTAGFGIVPTDIRGGASESHQGSSGTFHVQLDDDFSDNDQVLAVDFGSNVPAPASSCSQGQVLHADGTCVEPEISRNFFVYTAPKFPVNHRSAPAAIPKPKLVHNIVFVHTPEGQEDVDPVIVPPPQHKTLVYVLSKDQSSEQRVIEVPTGPKHNPEVFYINVEEGANPQLPIGIDLRSALAAAASQEGQLIEVGGSGATGAQDAAGHFNDAGHVDTAGHGSTVGGDFSVAQGHDSGLQSGNEGYSVQEPSVVAPSDGSPDSSNLGGHGHGVSTGGHGSSAVGGEGEGYVINAPSVVPSFGGNAGSHQNGGQGDAPPSNLYNTPGRFN